MMERLAARGEAIAQAAQTKHVNSLAAKLENELSGVRVEKTLEQVVLAGKNLLRRWLADPALRFVGSILR